MKLKYLASSLALVIISSVYIQQNIAQANIAQKVMAQESNCIKAEQEVEKLHLMYLMHFYVYKALKMNSIPLRHIFPPYSPTYPINPYQLSF